MSRLSLPTHACFSPSSASLHGAARVACPSARSCGCSSQQMPLRSSPPNDASNGRWSSTPTFSPPSANSSRLSPTCSTSYSAFSLAWSCLRTRNTCRRACTEPRVGCHQPIGLTSTRRPSSTFLGAHITISCGGLAKTRPLHTSSMSSLVVDDLARAATHARRSGGYERCRLRPTIPFLT